VKRLRTYNERIASETAARRTVVSVSGESGLKYDESGLRYDTRWGF
jgi:hypothetical protein